MVYLIRATAGGQVNTAGGDFVFQCKAIYDLDERGVTLYKPAIFSGSMFGALQSVREAFGPLVLDAIGYCGKWGQQVPSSGGSHYFLVLEPHASVGTGRPGMKLEPHSEGDRGGQRRWRSRSIDGKCTAARAAG